MSRLIRFLIDHTIVKLVKYVNAKTRNTPLENNRIYRHNLHAVLWERAIVESADFVQQQLQGHLLGRRGCSTSATFLFS